MIRITSIDDCFYLFHYGQTGVWKGELVEAAEWGDFVVENKEVLMDQMSRWIPLAKFTDIFPGTPYTVYLQKNAVR